MSLCLLSCIPVGGMIAPGAEGDNEAGEREVDGRRDNAIRDLGKGRLFGVRTNIGATGRLEAGERSDRCCLED